MAFAIGDLFGGLGSFASAAGDFAEASAYGTAAKYAGQNAVIAQEAGNIRQEQTGRAIYRTLGAQQAQYAGAGLTSGGSAQEVLRSSVSQGALEKAIVNEQTQINVTGYKEQQAQFQGMQAMADAAGGAGILGGLGKILSLIPGL